MKDQLCAIGSVQCDGMMCVKNHGNRAVKWCIATAVNRFDGESIADIAFRENAVSHFFKGYYRTVARSIDNINDGKLSESFASAETAGFETSAEVVGTAAELSVVDDEAGMI